MGATSAAKRTGALCGAVGGVSKIEVSADDGALQTDKERSRGPEGATGLHKVTAQIA